MNKKHTQDFMLNIVRQIAYLDLATMQAILQEAKDSQSTFESIGHILDPTAYRDYLHKGGSNFVSAQAEIVSHLIAIRELINEFGTFFEEGLDDT